MYPIIYNVSFKIFKTQKKLFKEVEIYDRSFSKEFIHKHKYSFLQIICMAAQFIYEPFSLKKITKRNSKIQIVFRFDNYNFRYEFLLEELSSNKSPTSISYFLIHKIFHSLNEEKKDNLKEIQVEKFQIYILTSLNIPYIKSIIDGTTNLKSILDRMETRVLEKEQFAIQKFIEAYPEYDFKKPQIKKRENEDSSLKALFDYMHILEPTQKKNTHKNNIEISVPMGKQPGYKKR